MAPSMTMKRLWLRPALGVVAASVFTVLIGCASYTTPGGPADFRAMGITGAEAAAQTESGIAERMSRRPLAGFPAGIALARVQGPGYKSLSGSGYGTGAYTIVPTRLVETPEQMARLGKLPMIRGIAPLNRLVTPPHLGTERELREAAANVQADMVLIYTFDTRFGSEQTVPFLKTITLGIFPTEEAQVTSTASCALIDTRNGYVYGLAEGTSRQTQAANAWTTKDAIDQSRVRAEREAFDGLVKQFESMWMGVVTAYGPK